MRLFKGLAVLTAALYASKTHAEALVSSPGERNIIPAWSMQPSSLVRTSMSSLSQPGNDVSSWYRVGPRNTVMAGLLENRVYDETELFYSETMKTLTGQRIFNEPWIYREEFALNPSDGQYFTLQTHGITSKAEIYVNGAQIASSEEQRGSYGGQQYDLTNHLQPGLNCLLAYVYPTDYLRDFAMGFLDWNPYPPDNGTGIWRHVEVIQTGAVSMSPLRVITDFTENGSNENVNVTLKTDLLNHVPHTIQVEVNGTIMGPIEADDAAICATFELKPGEKKTLAGGEQLLYRAQVHAMIQEERLVHSDSSSQKFGIRHISSYVNEHDDVAFTINGHPFQVLGAGYSADIFMRFDEQRLSTIFEYMIDLGLNTIRLEGKQEHPAFYDLADRMGIMVLAGWECCDKWEAWNYNNDTDGVEWNESDYSIAHAAMIHEAEMMQPHPSLLGFLVGSDYWPNDHATEVFLDALHEMDWNLPIIASASKRGFPKALGPSGMKMNGPYDWVPPNYWWGDKDGAAFGFGSELGAGVGTPEIGSLRRFLSTEELESLWKEPNAGSYHMSNNVSSFHNRTIYNEGLFARYGTPGNIEDYVYKCQMADYEATRAQFEAYSARQNATRPATGVIYWMLNSAWPNVHWQLFDYYLQPMGSYFGSKVGIRMEHVAYDYEAQTVWLINHSLEKEGERDILIDLIDKNGKKISSAKVKTKTTASSSKEVHLINGMDKIEDVGFLRLILRDSKTREDLSRNVYWLSPRPDVLDWTESSWISTPVAKYVNFTEMSSIPQANVKATMKPKAHRVPGWTTVDIEIENESKVPAVFLRLDIHNATYDWWSGPLYWSDNYVTLWPKEKILLTVSYDGDFAGTELTGSGFNANFI
ncbi:Glycoside hydrolasefamily 2N-terminal [Penicillium lividum]|nr:Glycoside hydrolasefamily 2N-terminal [Penicillium lividum]